MCVRPTRRRVCVSGAQFSGAQFGRNSLQKANNVVYPVEVIGEWKRREPRVRRGDAAAARGGAHVQPERGASGARRGGGQGRRRVRADDGLLRRTCSRPRCAGRCRSSCPTAPPPPSRGRRGGRPRPPSRPPADAESPGFATFAATGVRYARRRRRRSRRRRAS